MPFESNFHNFLYFVGGSFCMIAIALLVFDKTNSLIYSIFAFFLIGIMLICGVVLRRIFADYEDERQEKNEITSISQ